MSRPKTVMNHGMPAAGSLPTPSSLPCIRRDARSDTERPNECARSSQVARSCGTRSCQAASDSRTRASSSPNRRSAMRGTTCGPSRSGTMSSRRSQRSRGSSSRRYDDASAVDLALRATGSPASARARPSRPRAGTGCWPRRRRGWTVGGSGSAFSGSPSAKSKSLTAKMSAKSHATSIPSSSDTGRIPWFWTTMRSCIASPMKRSRMIETSSASRSSVRGLRR